MGALIPSIAFFFLSHLYSTVHYWPRDGLSSMAMGDLFIDPYTRIIPMHAVAFAGLLLFNPGLGIPVGIANSLVLVIFLFAKMYLDVRAHRKKHAHRFR